MTVLAVGIFVKIAAEMWKELRMEKPTADDIVAAVKASGYLMEQEVATTIESLGFHVETSRGYEDIDEGKSREIDVWGIQRVHQDETNQISVFVELICECKNNQNPFVFLTRQKNEADRHLAPEEYVFPSRDFPVPIENRPNAVSLIPAFRYLDLAKANYRFQTDHKAVQFAKIVRDKKDWSANHAGLYDSIFYPMVKALLSRRKEIPRQGDYRYVWLFFPLVVTNGEIFQMDSWISPLIPRSVDYISMRRHLRSKRMDGEFNLDFVTQAGLTEFISKRIEPFIQAVVQRVKAAPEFFRPNPAIRSTARTIPTEP